MRKPLILVGGGGHCKSVIDVAESAGYEMLGVLDMPEDVGKDVLVYKVIGTDDDIYRGHIRGAAACCRLLRDTRQVL